MLDLRKGELLKNWVVVVPVKAPGRAKSRLTEFSDSDRAALATAFALDVIDALVGCSFVGTIRVVTDDTDFAALARETGCQVLDDPTDSLNRAIVFGARFDSEGGSPGPNGPVAVVVSDLPCATSKAFDSLFDQCLAALYGPAPRAQAFLRDQAGHGTTFLAARAPGELNPLFGPHSAEAHIGVGALELGNIDPSLRLDVDTAAELTTARKLGVGPHTAAVLAER
jgi:2-phospho-L-lactate guanylyltransferase